jgi:hypothetical protein
MRYRQCKEGLMVEARREEKSLLRARALSRLFIQRLSFEKVHSSDYGAYGTGDEDAALEGIGVGSGACPFP